MKLITVYIFIFSVFITVNSQESAKIGGEEKDNLPRYDVTFDMKELVYHKYRFTENTKVKRVMEDSTITEYEKTTTYFFNIFVPGPKDDNGFLLVEVSSDSMDYKFETDNRKIEHFTQDYEKTMPINFLDYLQSFLPNGKYFTILYSTYGDVAELNGERLAAERKEYNQIEDSLKQKLLINSVNDEKLKFLFNVPKNIYPPFKVKNDTTWKNEIEFYICSTPLYGEVTHKFDGYSNKEYHISTSIDSLKIRSTNTSHYFPDLDTYGTIIKGITNGSMETDLYTNGTIKYIRANLNSELTGAIGNFKYEQNVESTFTWDLLGRYSYK